MPKNIITFNVVAPIVTKARPRARVVNGHAQIYTKNDTLIYENLVRLKYQEKFNDFKFLDNAPLGAFIEVTFKAPNTIVELLNKAKDENLDYKYENLPCLVHKDLDNIAKTVLDALNGIAYKDDKQISELNCQKSYGERDSIEIILYELDCITIDDVKREIQLSKLTKRYLSLKDKYEEKKSPKIKAQMEKVDIQIKSLVKEAESGSREN